MKKFFDELNESTITGGYPDSGTVKGVSTDDDLPTGTTVFGDKMVKVEVENRLTGKTIKYVPADEVGQTWNYDEFEHSKGMGSYDSYSDTLDGLKNLLGDRLWKHTSAKKQTLGIDKVIARSETDIDQDTKLADDKDDETMDIQEKIDRYLDEPEEINEEIVDASDRKVLTRAIMSGKASKLKIKSLGIDATLENDGEEVTIQYPKSDDFTLTLVDISDALGYSFDVGKNKGKTEFTIYIN